MGRAAVEMKRSREKYLSWKIMLRKSSFFEKIAALNT